MTLMNVFLFCSMIILFSILVRWLRDIEQKIVELKEDIEFLENGKENNT